MAVDTCPEGFGKVPWDKGNGPELSVQIDSQEHGPQKRQSRHYGGFVSTQGTAIPGEIRYWTLLPVLLHQRD